MHQFAGIDSATGASRGNDFVGEQIGGVNGENHVHDLRGRHHHCYDDAVGQVPKAEQVGADFRMRDVDKLFLDFVKRHAFLFGLDQGARKMPVEAGKPNVFPPLPRPGQYW